MLSIQTAVGMCAAALSVAPSGVVGPPTLATDDATCAACSAIRGDDATCDACS